jgi:hypothetical protein
MTMSAASPLRASRVAIISRDIAHGSRLIAGAPLAASRKRGSMKSGPHLAEVARRPRAERAAISPIAIVVLPE